MDRRDREAAAMVGAAAALRECRAALAARGTTVIREAIGRDRAADAEDWRHYPAGEVYDPVSHFQYFYHRHPRAPDEAEAAEAGHFHVFMRGEGMPPGTVPVLLPDAAVANAPRPRRLTAPQSAPLKRGVRDEVCHLVAIAVDPCGEPVRLFTTNRWVTGETWYRAEAVMRILDRVRAPGDGGDGPALLSRWIVAVLNLYRREIAALLAARDNTITEWRWRWPRSNALEDARLEVTSSRAIDLAARLAESEAAAATSPGERRRRLPPMAEGWGA